MESRPTEFPDRNQLATTKATRLIARVALLLQTFYRNLSFIYVQVLTLRPLL
jgi:hypothetical protein